MTDHPLTGRHPAGRAGPAPDEALIRLLHDQHAGPLLGFVLRLVDGDRRRAEAVVEQTLVQAWRNVQHLDADPAALRPWLVAVARRITAQGAGGERASGPQAVPDVDELARALRLMAVSEALDDLTAAHREVIVETYLKGRTANAAAAALGVPSETVRSTLFYALRSLKLALDERGVTT
ncbi:sigma-70 family RNA polymerase sigma factor [Kitasatospora sp. NPDC050543]|uniref:sigma-70 family RNA polymerase sigma factor n=1 Tax=Kitasatospora sp. NPDC050543 TaxID=3364054 RepID=UPI0037B8383C